MSNKLASPEDLKEHAADLNPVSEDFRALSTLLRDLEVEPEGGMALSWANVRAAEARRILAGEADSENITLAALMTKGGEIYNELERLRKASRTHTRKPSTRRRPR